VENLLQQFGFFDGAVTPRAPTGEEIDGIIAQLSLFYQNTLQPQYPNLQSFEAVYTSDSFDETDDWPVSIGFVAYAFFTEDSDAPLPTAEELFSAMENGDFNIFIQEYAWQAVPEQGLFFDTQRTVLSNTDGTVSGALETEDTDAPSGIIPPTGTERVLVPSVLHFGFFDGTEQREPTAEEVEGIVPQISSFYANLLQLKYPNLQSFEAVFTSYTSSSFDEETFPVSILFDATAFFTIDTESTTTIPTVEELFVVLQNADYNTFIQEYAWQANPTQGLFFQVQSVAYDLSGNQDEGDSDQYTEPNMVVVESRLEFFFFNDANSRAPTQDEVNGVLAQADLFYNSVFIEQHPTFEMFQAVNVGHSFDETTGSVNIDFDAQVYFTESATTAADAFATMESADYQDFIISYVWKAQPEDGLFFSTQQVAYTEVVPLPGDGTSEGEISLPGNGTSESEGSLPGDETSDGEISPGGRQFEW
jgi:hypothetical protein